MKSIPMFLLALLPAFCLPLAGAELTVRGYGLADPANHKSPLLATEASQRAALLDLRRQLLYFGGTSIEKTAGGYAIVDKGRIRDAEPSYRNFSPAFAEASMTSEVPEALSQRVMQIVEANLSYTAALDLNSFASCKAYLSWADDALVKALGDELTKKGYFKSGSTITLDFLHFERAFGKKKIAAKIWYVAKR